VIQRAILHVQSSGKDTVTGANVLVALFSERDSYAVYFLQQQDMSRLDAVSFISHGIGKGGRKIEDKNPKGSSDRKSRATRKRPRRADRRRIPRSTSSASTSTRRRWAARSTR
jgi:ATP-dependent Clp protease ATP-binding subunit ClpA